LHRYPLGGTPAVELDVLADRATSSVPTEGLLQHYRDLVSEATVLFGATHYRNYRFLWTLSDQIMEDGIEHHESSDDRSPLRSLQDDDLRRVQASLLPHEYVHSWNGKFRRPVGLATPDYQTPMKGELLWVYEGLTEYLGNVLAVRSGLLTVDEFRDELARLAAQMDLHHGRDWRSLEDSVAAASLLYYQDKNWAARLRRQDDFYQESALLWLEADTLIRRLSGGVRSLDAFCAHFYGGVSGVAKVIPYDFDGLVTALNDVQPYDWRKFWRERLTRLGGGAPMTGLESAGWSLAYSAVPSSMHVAHEHDDHALNLQYSLGFQIAEEGGTISDIVPGSPADLAKMAPGSHLIAVNGHRYNAATMGDTLADTAASTIEVLLEKDDEYVRYELRYNGGMRYPSLQANGDADLLRRIAAPRRGP
jgi:predicted metalloprotease with PDZ domain